MRSGQKNTKLAPSASEVTAQLDAILDSSSFIDSPKLSEFLRYVVGETLAGRAGRIKGFNVAQAVFDRTDPEDAQTSTIVRVEARRLRQKLEDYYATNRPDNGIYIEIPVGTYVPNFRYINGADFASESPSPAGIDQHPSQLPFLAGIPTRQRVITAIGLLSVIFITWYVATFVLHKDEATRQLEALTDPLLNRPSIAVVPFVNMMDNRPEGNILAYGLTEDIITDLSRSVDIDVVALSSMTSLGENADIQLIAKKYGVSHVLLGSVRSHAEQVRVTAQLMDTGTTNQLWAGRYDRAVNDALALEDDLSGRITHDLSTKLGLDTAGGNAYQWNNIAASTMFTQALHLVNPPINPARIVASRIEFERIIDLEPDFAGGYAGVAYTSAFMAFWRHDIAWEQYVDEAIEYAEKALELDENFGLAYSALAFGYLSSGEFEKSLSVSAEGVSKQANDPYGNAYHGILLAVNGQADKGVSFLKRALYLDPLNPRTPFLNILGFVYLLANDPENALSQFERNIARGGPVSITNTIHRAIALKSLGRDEEASKLVQDIKATTPSFGIDQWVSWVNRTVRYPIDQEKLLKPVAEIGLF